MARKVGTVGDVARRSGVSRWTVYRTVRGRTRPRPGTLEKLRRAGIEIPAVVRLEIPRNVHDFAQHFGLSLNEVEKLVNTELKPVDLMTERELQHVLDGMSSFPGLYTWHSRSPAQRQS